MNLEQILETCETCQRFIRKPTSFNGSVPGVGKFDYNIALDAAKLGKQTALHIIDTQK